MSSGRFWAIGVGPGDPELLTLKAVRLLRQAQVIYHAGPQPRQGRAWEIVRDHVRPDQEVRVVLTDAIPSVSASNGMAAYAAGVEQIASDCRQGRDVVYVAEGDPTLYSTAGPIVQLLAQHAPEISREIVPGVTSITAAAARVGWSLARREQLFAVVPASYHQADLPALLERFPSLCMLKAAAALPGLAAAVERCQGEAVYVENVGSPREWITKDLAEAAGRNEYFALVLVRRREGDAENSRAGPGRIDVVGIGPGANELLTMQARSCLQQAQALVGYEAYLRLLEPLRLRGEIHASPIGAERERAAQALELAQRQQRVVVVSSGDAGVYGMASLLLESAAMHPEIEVAVVPGVTAASAAAALLGAPLGHDFACVSLSDLLTSWDVIEGRLRAVAEGDFVLALYNPLSRRRTWQLPRAREVLLSRRDPQTPVGIVDRAHRPGMSIRHTSLAELSAEGIGMETLLIIGNSQTRVLNGRMVTPRGYSVAE